MSASSDSGLLRSIARWDLVAVVLNGVIGAGIFGLPSKVFALAGNLSIPAFLACAVCAILIVLSFAEVASRYSASGGPYLYATEAFGPLTGFTVGWLVWMARVTSFSANCSLLPNYLDLLFPGAATGLARMCILATVVMIFAIVNVTGVRVAANASNVFAAGKLIPLAIFVIVGLFFLDPARFTQAAAPDYRSFSQAVTLLVYAFTGFEMAVIPAGEVRQPQSNLPAALMIGMGAVVVFYVLIQVVCIGTLPGLATSTRPLGDAASQFLGPAGALMITIGIVISLAGNLNVLILAGSRILHAMAGRAALPRILAVVDPRYHTPVPAVLATCGVMLILTLSGTFIYLVTLSTISRLITYLLTAGTLPVFRKRSGSPPALFLVPGGMVVSGLAMILCLWLLSNTTVRELRDAAIATAVGLSIYLWTRLSK